MPYNYAHLRWCEFALLFIALPLVLYAFRAHLASVLMPLLLCFMLLCGSLLWTDPSFKRFRLTNVGQFKRIRRRMLILLSLGMCATSFAYIQLLPISPHQGESATGAFALPLETPVSWLWLLLLYPLASVIPQELIFRTYFFHRYKKIMPSKQLRVFVSALVFAFAHIIYDNLYAVGFSFVGGLLFASSYALTRSTFVIVVEHSLWGIWLFTLGFGRYLDSGLIT